MDQVVSEANARPRFTLVLLAAFAGVALVLAAVGVYGVMTYAVSRRLHEIGVRLALGAEPFAVVRMVVREGMSVALTGAAIGVVGALLLTRSMSGFLYGVRPGDPLTFAGVSLVLVGAALIATYLPARRASRTDRSWRCERNELLVLRPSPRAPRPASTSTLCPDRVSNWTPDPKRARSLQDGLARLLANPNVGRVAVKGNGR
jgi:hypothetical protein